MSNRVKSLIKAAEIIQGLPGCEEELAKEGGALSSVGQKIKDIAGHTVTKVVGGTAAAGAAAGGGYLFGKKKGREKGLTEGEQFGRQEQLKSDVQRFRGAAKNIYALGRTHQRASDMAALRQHFLRGMASRQGQQKQPNAMPKPPASKNIKEMTYRPNVKKAEDKMAAAVYDGWARGNVEVDALCNLPPIDLEKIATVVVNRMHDGDQRAAILWSVLTSK